MFAEDEGLLPRGIFTGLLAKRRPRPGARREPLDRCSPPCRTAATTATTTSPGSTAACSPPSTCRRWNAPSEPPCSAAADMDWRAIDPTIFGTLFERGLTRPSAPLGAHYTDPATIMRLIDPVIVANR
jgi:hypothetical protein